MKHSMLFKSLAVISVCLGITIFGAQTAHGLYNYSQVDSLLAGGMREAGETDNLCRSNLSSNRGASSLRTAINGEGSLPTASYMDSTWLSERNRPNTVSPTFVTWGATSVPLQVNSMTFICGGLVTADLFGTQSGTCGGALCAGANVDRIVNDPDRWVTSRRPDRIPNDIGNVNMLPARVASQSRIESFDVTQGGGSITGGIGQVLTVTRDDDSRYWFSPKVDVTYVNPAGIRAATTLRVVMYYRPIMVYSGNVGRCISAATGGSINVRPGDFSSCAVQSSVLSILLQPNYNYDYELIPNVNNIPGTIERGTQLNPTYNVTKDRSNSLPTDYAFKRFVIPPGGNFNELSNYIDNVTSNNDARYGSTVNAESSPSSNATFVSANTVVSPLIGDAPRFSNVDTSGYGVGTRICFLLAVDPPRQATPVGQARWSAPKCATVAKSPNLVIKNGDAWAGGSFRAVAPTCPVSGGDVRGRSSVSSAGTYGSYGEYGVFALGAVVGFGSAGKPATSTSLTFKRPNGNFYTSTTSVPNETAHCLQDANETFAVTSADQPAGATFSTNGKNGKYYYNGNLTINSGDPVLTLSINQRVQLYVNGNITILKNIEFPNAGNLSEMASLVIMATGNIDIDKSVTRLDGYYQARGTLNTCMQSPLGTTSVNLAECGNPLVINGAINVGKFVPKRHAGGDILSRNQPAETITMRPDVFLSQYGRASGNGQLQTVDETELPPRY